MFCAENYSVLFLMCFSIGITQELRSFTLRHTSDNDVADHISEIHTKDYGKYYYSSIEGCDSTTRRLRWMMSANYNSDLPLKQSQYILVSFLFYLILNFRLWFLNLKNHETHNRSARVNITHLGLSCSFFVYLSLF